LLGFCSNYIYFSFNIQNIGSRTETHSYSTLKISNSKSITVTTPTSETLWERGTGQYITWETTGKIINLIIELWKGGIFQLTIVIDTKNDQAKYWEIPNATIADDDYRIKIIDSSNTSIFAFSEEFEIYTVPDLWVVTPHSASAWKADSSEFITWETSGRIFVQNVDIELYDGIEFKLSIVNNTPNDGIYLWFIPYDPKPGHEWSIKIKDSKNPSINGFSDHFEIYSEKSIKVRYPKGFRHWGAPNDYFINWTWTGDIEKVNIEMYNGLDLIYSINEISNNGSYLWFLPLNIVPSMSWRIKIYSSDYFHIYDISDDFQIYIIKTITVVYPNVSDVWSVGGYYDIQWIATGNTSFVKIELYENGKYFKTIASRTPNDGRYLYKASGIDYSARYKIKISAYEDESISDFSDEFFRFKKPQEINPTLIFTVSALGGLGAVISITLSIRHVRRKRLIKTK